LFDFPFKIVEMENAEENEAIGKRLRQFREGTKIARSRFAVAIGYGTERLASYESGRAPLPYVVFVEIAKRFHLNPFWLATGEGEPDWKTTLDFPSPDELGVSRIAKFIDVFNRYLAGIFPIKSFEIPGEVISRQHQASTVRRFIDNTFISIPKNQVRPLADTLLNTAKTFLQKYGQDDPQAVMERKVVQKTLEIAATAIHLKESRKSFTPAKNNAEPLAKKISVDNIGVKDNIGDVKHSLPNLLERLKKATAERGKKSALAKALGVPLVNVSKWLSGVREPGGETTLKLLTWVEHQERQK
jgi:transcriptional regulator with XRE-family HTH domain